MRQGILFVFLLIIFINFAFAKVSYDPDQLKQFESTNQCPGCDLTEVNLGIENHNNANLTQALLTKGEVGLCQFAKADFTRANLVQLDAAGAMMSGAVFVNANLSYSIFKFANLSRADFSGAILTNINLSHATLIQANITNEQLSEAISLSCTIMPDGTRHTPDSGDSCN